MTRLLLAVNAGSTSLKFALFSECAASRSLIRGEVHGLPQSPVLDIAGHSPTDLHAGIGLDGALLAVLDWCTHSDLAERVSWVVNRVAHGEHRVEPQALDDALLDDLDRLAAYAPLHQPANVRIARKLREAFPKASHWACFDTAFHAGISRLESAFAINPAFYQQGIRKWGYHGLSYAWIARHLLAKHPLITRAVVAHLGGGSSACAIVDGRSVATTMGMTALDGLPMSTRSGTIDSGAVLSLARQLGVDQAEYLLYHHSGLQGLSKLSGDMRQLRSSREPDALFAIDHYCLRTAQAIAALTVAAGGLDALVFTGGIGTNDYKVREQVAAHLKHLKPFSMFAARTDEEAEMSIQVLSAQSREVS